MCAFLGRLLDFNDKLEENWAGMRFVMFLAVATALVFSVSVTAGALFIFVSSLLMQNSDNHEPLFSWRNQLSVISYVAVGLLGLAGCCWLIAWAGFADWHDQLSSGIGSVLLGTGLSVVLCVLFSWRYLYSLLESTGFSIVRFWNGGTEVSWDRGDD